jgi:hypothetical protein
MKNLKPTEYDLHLKYSCPNCGYNHWLSIHEAQTDKFLIVCDCKKILKVKTVDSFKIKYKTKKNAVITNEKDYIKKAISGLLNYGFSKQEATYAVEKAIKENDITDPVQILKIALKKIGEQNVEHS